MQNPVMSKSHAVIPIERIASRIYLIREQKVMLDSDLAELYGVETGALVRSVKRNARRFPMDFSFQLSELEYETLRCQIGISNGRGGRRYRPYVFTEQGVAMLSSVLRSPRAADVNVAIMRTFVRLREILATHKDLARKVEEHDEKITLLIQAVQKILAPESRKKNPIGYVPPKE